MKLDPSAAAKLERKSWLGALAAIKILETRPDVTLPALCHELAATHGTQLALAGEHQHFTYQKLSETIIRYANWAAVQGAFGDTISLLMPNGPEYAAIWLGISQAGCAAALLNTALAADALAHCINAASSNILIFSAEFLPVVKAAMPKLSPTMLYWVHGAVELAHPFQPIEAYIEAAPLMPVSRNISAQRIAVLIYTSGTTGLPKAVKLSHRRLIEWSFWFAGMLEITPQDRLYNCLPMYHSTGGIVAIGAMLSRGGTVVIREHFSASKFWRDIAAEKCTILIYIGELCRYLTRNAPSIQETDHRLRLCCGNGLSGDVWEIFQSRFQIPRIIEFYAATEGSVSLYNCAGKPGAVGHVPTFLAHSLPTVLARTDPATSEILRDVDGLCEICDADEPGEALGKIATPSHLPSRKFDGYTDAQASQEKIVHDVLAAGDAWFRTGDLLRRDANGFFYFIERLGETFRWKGENVSAAEVASVIRSCPGVSEAIVFGVAIPGYEGRVGMAAMTVDTSFTFDVFRAYAETRLPDYARPVFIRLCEKLETTETFKYKRHKALELSFSTALNTEGVWFYDRARQKFTPFNAFEVQRLLEKIPRL